MLKPSVTIPELVANGHKLDGVVLCDEWSHVGYPDHDHSHRFDYPLEAGVKLCVKALVNPEGGDFSIKLEDQVLITEDGYENLTKYPFDPALTGNKFHSPVTA